MVLLYNLAATGKVAMHTDAHGLIPEKGWIIALWSMSAAFTGIWRLGIDMVPPER